MITRCAIFVLLSLFALPVSPADDPSTQRTKRTKGPQPAQAGDSTNNPQVRLTTSHGVIELQLDAQKAPKTVANFMRHVKSGFYNDTIFHRVIPGFMIQGGGMARGMKEKPTSEKIPNEADNGLKNLTGTISMARTSDPHSASAQFFINTADNALLNHRGKDPAGWGYAVFGKVTKGMDVVRAIEAAATGNVGVHQNVPLSDIVITKAETFKGPSFEQAGSASAVKPKPSGASNATNIGGGSSSSPVANAKPSQQDTSTRVSRSIENARVGKNCRELYSEMDDLVTSMYASKGANLVGGRFHDQDLWKRHLLLRYVNMHPACEDGRSEKEMAARYVTMGQEHCRKKGIKGHTYPSGIPMTNCDSGVDLAGIAADAEALINKRIIDEKNARIRHVTPERGRADDIEKAEAACRVALDRLVTQYKAAEHQIPKESVVVRSEATMWLIAKSAEVIEAECPESKKYAAQVDYGRKMYKESQRVCDAMASVSSCKPRLPGKEPVPPTPVASKPLPPLNDKLKGSCGMPPSASAVKCLEAKCAKEGGELKLADRGCYACINYGRNWFACPDGRGAAQ